jgi:uncharacterized FlaG/YvyC family protein
MKTETIPGNRNQAYGLREKPQPDSKESQTKGVEKTSENRLDKQPSKRIELEKSLINNTEAIQKMIGESIEWRDLRFYQRQEGGQYYIDVVDRATGNVIRTVPDTKFGEFFEKYKQLSGLKINISG